MKTIKIKKILLVTLLAASIVSCKKQFDQLPETQLDASQMYRDVYDANAAVIGLYGKFMSLSDRYIVLNELRADLMKFTMNADESLRQLSTHTVSADNPYANPRPFYELINNCNDVLKNFVIMRQKNTLGVDEFNQRYSDIACLRSFLYLQLGIHYGRVPYITQPLENLADLNDINRFPKLELPQLIDSLVEFTDAIPFKGDYPPAVGAAIGASLNVTLDGYPTSKFFINKRILLGDLHLWKGDYQKAATYYRQVMETATTGTVNDNYYTQYKNGWGTANMYISYGRAGDVSTLNYENGWGSWFFATDDRFNREIIWALPYDSRFKPANPLINLFSPVGGSYQVTASEEIMDNWNRQQQAAMTVSSSLTVGTAGIPFDARKLISVRNVSGQPTIMKFITNYVHPGSLTTINPFNKNGRWFLYRQAHLHLRFAEAANRAGYPKLAYALYNNGIPNVYQSPANTPDKTIWQNTLDLPAPFNFDARNGEIPYYRGEWYRNIGIRARANLINYSLSATSVADSISQNEIGLLNESALETAFEGNRWSDLLRIAIRRNDPSVIADKVYDRMRKDGVGDPAAVRAKLMTRDWFLPFKLQ
ncbi:RagB/SusD family protein [Aridibaculum aurantiacum]|uniref:RagB/SusD family protein n=1 Tax=Aridibaculum aurantiacum TaxID=2810307 RepID=UPI001A958856|nr:RagB/SusD family protein [Aridibaculum aurantiacum]